MDPVGLVEGVLTPLRRARDAINGVTDVKASLRLRYADYTSIIEPLKRKPDVIATTEIKREVEQLAVLFTRVADLIDNYTAAPTDGRLAKINIKAKRAAYWQDVENELAEIDADVMRQLATMNLKGAISSSEISLEMKALLEQIKALLADISFPSLDPIKKLLDEMRPPGLPDMAAVPAGAQKLPPSYVERASVQVAVGGLIDPEMALTPFTVVGMGGGGKTTLASAIVREPRVRKHFRGGVFWTRVGRGQKEYLLPLLQGLAREVGAAPTDTPHAVPHDLCSVPNVQQHLAWVSSMNAAARTLVVLDDVWEREVVQAFLHLGFKVLVTTRDRSVVDVPGGLLELGDMEGDEALDLLLKASMAVGKPRDDVRIHLTKVAALCGRLPLALAIAGSMPVVKGKGLKACAWQELADHLGNEATKMWESGQEGLNINMVFETSFSALAARKRREFLRLAVLPPGFVAPIEMLLNLWEMEDEESTREEAEGLASKCLLQDTGGAYRVHDLVLDFVKIKISAHGEMLGKATTLQAQFLGRPDVVRSYHVQDGGTGNQGLFLLIALWRWVQKLSGDPGLEMSSYRATLGELELCEATASVASFFHSLSCLYILQGIYNEAESLQIKSIDIAEKTLGPEHTDLARYLNDRAVLMDVQGKMDVAEPLHKRSLAIREKVLGPEHPDFALSLASWGLVLALKGRHDEAEAILERAQAIQEKALGPEHPDVVKTLSLRGRVLLEQGKYTEDAMGTIGQAKADMQRQKGNRLVPTIQKGKGAEADSLYGRAIEIGEKVLGPDHPDVAILFNNKGVALSYQGKWDEALQSLERCQAIQEKVLGPEHPSLAETLFNRADISDFLGKYAEAELLFERCQAIEEKSLRPNHPNLARTLNCRWMLAYKQGKYCEAYLFRQRELQIWSRVGAGRVSTLTRVLGVYVVVLTWGGAFSGGMGAAMLGALAIRATKDYGIDRAARKAGTVADVAMEKAQDLERKFEVSTKVKAATGRAKQAAQNIDSSFSVSQRAKEAATRTVGAERLAGAVKATERAANAVSSFRSKVKRSIDKKKPGES